MLLLLQLHLLQLFQQLLWGFGVVLILLLVLGCWRLLDWRRLNRSVLRLLISSVLGGCIFIAFLLRLGLRLWRSHWLWWLTSNGARATASSRRKDHTLYGSWAVRTSQNHVIKTGSTEDAGQHVAFRRRAKVDCNAL